MFTRFLKVAENCPVCGEELSHHRADDFPAYIVVLFVGHLMVGLGLSVEEHFSPPFWLHLGIIIPTTLLLCLLLLQPVKGMVVALQWRMGMHGFGQSKANRTSRS